MKKVIIKTVILMATAILFAQCTTKDSAVKIGIDIPLSGDYKYWGEEFKNGVDIYLSQNPEVKVIIEDNQSETKNVGTAAQKLLEINNVDALVSMFVPFSFPLREIAENAGKPLISTFNSSTTFNEGFNHCYTDFATHDMQLPMLVDYVTDSINLTKGVYLCVNDDYGTDGARIAKELLAKKGISLEGEFYNTGESDFRNFLAKRLTKDVQFVFVIARNRDLINAVNQIRERNKEILILGVGSFDAPEVWEGINEKDQDNIIFASSYFHKDYNDESRMFYDEFYKRNQRDPNYPAVFGYTICQYLATVITEAKKNSTSVDDLLKAIDYNSIRGRITMTDTKFVHSPIAIYKRSNNQSIPVSIEE